MRILVAILLVSLCLLQCRKINEPFKVNTPKEETPSFANDKSKKYVDGEVIVTFKDGNADNLTMQSVGATVKERIQTKAMERSAAKPFYVLKVGNVEQAIDALKRNPKIQSASPNYIIRTDVDNYPNDPFFTDGSLWGMNNIHAQTVWQNNKGSQQVIIGLIDEGIFFWHEDLCGQIWNNPYDTADGIDNDGNGYVDDIHGWCFYHNHNKIFDGKDEHGTHTAGTAGAAGNNNTGVIGVSPQVTIISAKFLEGNGSTSAAIQAIDYITDLKLRHGLNIPCTSNSWGYEGADIPELESAIDRANQADILFVAAAGNNHADNEISNFYPANSPLPNVISVAAIDVNDNLASFSNWGATKVDIGAPGVNVLSTTYGTVNGALTSTYSAFSGTSMATPHVSGAVALYKASHPAATAADIKNALLSHARQIPALAGKCVSNGTLDLQAFTETYTETPVSRECEPYFIDVTPPSIPQKVRIEDSTATSIKVGWSPSVDLESGIYFYGVQVKRVNLPDLLLSTFDTLLNVTGLSPALPYTFIIYAINNANLQSAGSDPVTGHTVGTPDTEPPTVPGNYHIIDSNLTGFTVGWTKSTDNTGVAVYETVFSSVNSAWHGGANTYSNGGDLLNWYVTVTGAPSHELIWMHTRAKDIAGNPSEWTDTLWVHTDTIPGTPPPPPPPPPNPTITLTGQLSGNNTHVLNWTTNLSGAATIQYSTPNQNNFHVLTTVNGTSYSYTQTATQKFYYKVVIGSTTSNTVSLQSKKK